MEVVGKQFVIEAACAARSLDESYMDVFVSAVYTVRCAIKKSTIEFQRVP